MRNVNNFWIYLIGKCHCRNNLTNRVFVYLSFLSSNNLQLLKDDVTQRNLQFKNSFKKKIYLKIQEKGEKKTKERFSFLFLLFDDTGRTSLKLVASRKTNYTTSLLIKLLWATNPTRPPVRGDKVLKDKTKQNS